MILGANLLLFIEKNKFSTNLFVFSTLNRTFAQYLLNFRLFYNDHALGFAACYRRDARI